MAMTATASSNLTLVDRLAAVRRQIDDTKERMEWLHKAPLVLDEALAQVDGVVDALAASSELSREAGYLFRPTYRGEALGAFEPPVIPCGEQFSTVKIELGPLLAGLFPDAMKTSLKAAVKARAAEIESGPPLAERPAQRLALEKRLFELETEEEAIIVEAEGTGQEGLYRRADVNPAIVLGLPGQARPQNRTTTEEVSA